MVGFFVVFEGGEGCGKSTQSRLLADDVRASGREVLLTREPGGSPRGESIRDLILDPGAGDLSPEAEALLFAAARADHVASTIRPALERGAVVICDRYIDSSIAYQGSGRSLGPLRIQEISEWATDRLLPDLTVVLDIDPVVGLARADDRNRLEDESLEFHSIVRQAFLDLAQIDPGRYLVLDADRSVAEVRRAVVSEVSERLGL